MDLIHQAFEFENQKFSLKTMSDRIIISRKAKTLILELNELYKQQKDEQIMDLMKRLTTIKRKAEKRLKGRP